MVRVINYHIPNTELWGTLPIFYGDTSINYFSGTLTGTFEEVIEQSGNLEFSDFIQHLKIQSTYYHFGTALDVFNYYWHCDIRYVTADELPDDEECIYDYYAKGVSEFYSNYSNYTDGPNNVFDVLDNSGSSYDNILRTGFSTNGDWVYIRFHKVFDNKYYSYSYCLGVRDNKCVLRTYSPFGSVYNIDNSFITDYIPSTGKHIYYTPINCTLSGPETTFPGDNVSVIITPNSGHIIKDPTQGANISVYNKDGYIPFTYNNNQIDFTVP